MSVVNQDPNVEAHSTVIEENIPGDADLGITKLWAWKPGTAPAPAADGMIYYVAYDSATRGPDGLPLEKIRFVPEDLAYRINYLPKGRCPYPTPSKKLAPDEELWEAGPGMFNVRKKQPKPIEENDIPPLLLEIKNLCIEILNRL
jgi:hypothetical protein